MLFTAEITIKKTPQRIFQSLSTYSLYIILNKIRCITPRKQNMWTIVVFI